MSRRSALWQNLLFRWRDAFCSAEGPPATTRLVLWTLSKHMSMDGTDAFPNQEMIAIESGLGLRAVKRHLRVAEDLGWIERKPRRRGVRESWRYGTDYVPRFPLIGAQKTPIGPHENGVVGNNIGVSESTLVSEGTTSTSSNSSPELIELIGKDLHSDTKARERVEKRRAARDAFVADYDAEQRRAA